ncbi:MAG: diguanylate cyclase [Clostridiales bacterium]|nr:diguanylate cyclase [Clostridiales bacterium]
MRKLGKLGKFRNYFVIRLTLYYVFFAGAWITFSDRILASAVTDIHLLTQLQTYKGWLFVIVTGSILFLILHLAFQSRIRTEHQLLEANEKLSALIQATPLAIITLDPQERVMSWNSAAETMFGWKEKEVLGCRNPIVPEDEWLAFRKLHRQALAGKTVYGTEVTRQKKDGTTIELSLSNAVIRNAQGDIRGIVVVLADISEQKVKEEQLKYLSLHDSLTGIYNRAYFEQEMQRLEAGRYLSVGMIVCDVDGLKLYNDSFGHSVGDALLKAAAEVIKGCFRDSDMVARIGGDEFAILLPDSDKSAVEQAYLRIRKSIASFNEESRGLYLSMSIGYAVSEGQIRMADLFKEADDNMYKEKYQHNNNSGNEKIIHELASRNLIPYRNIERKEAMPNLKPRDTAS